MFRFAIIIAVATFAASNTATQANASAAVAIPDISCPSGGQNGPSPSDHPPGLKTVKLAPGMAGRLAFYDGVLAPRGWHCVSIMGDVGPSVYVSLREYRAAFFLADGRIAGPGVVFHNLDGVMGGAYPEARYAARYFPKARQVVTKAEEIEPESRHLYVFHPYRGDKVLARGAWTVDVLTPAHRQGQGAEDFVPDALPAGTRVVFGFDGEDPAVTVIGAKLQPEQSTLLPVILGQRP